MVSQVRLLGTGRLSRPERVRTVLHVLVWATASCAPGRLAAQTKDIHGTPPGAAATLAQSYLFGIDTSIARPSRGHSVDQIFVGASRVGNSRTRYDGTRVIVVADTARPKVVWDSFTLHDRYFALVSVDDIDVEEDGPDAYWVAMSGCAPHECAGGASGYAVYSSRTRRVYVSHVTTGNGGSRVTFWPRSGIPETFRAELKRMVCADRNVRAEQLPFTCIKAQ